MAKKERAEYQDHKRHEIIQDLLDRVEALEEGKKPAKGQEKEPKKEGDK